MSWFHSKLNGFQCNGFNYSSIEFCQKHSNVKLRQQQCHVRDNFSLFMLCDVKIFSSLRQTSTFAVKISNIFVIFPAYYYRFKYINEFK